MNLFLTKTLNYILYEPLKTVFEGEKSDISCDQYAYFDRGSVHEFQRRSITFYTAKYWYRSPQDLNNISSLEDKTPFIEVSNIYHNIQSVHIPFHFYSSSFFHNTFLPLKLLIPEDAEVRTFGDSGLLELRTDWSPPNTNSSKDMTWKAGSLIANPMEKMMNNDWSEAKVLFEPTLSVSLEGQSGTKDFLVSSSFF